MKKFISLLSGGLDSPIASYLMIQKGFQPVFLTFLTSDDINHTMREKVIQIVQKLADFTDKEVKLFLIDHDPNLDAFKNACERKLTCVLCKRLMLRLAMRIGQEENVKIVVTGDILGEQASQTLDNLFSYNDLIKSFTLLRPLIGFNKMDVIKLSEKVGLYDLSSINSAGCQYNPQYPETHAKVKEINEAENIIEINQLIMNSILNTEVLIF